MIVEMQQEESVQKLRDYAFRLISMRPRSVWELQQSLQTYCRKHQIPEDVIATVVDDLTARAYLSDTSFIQWWIEQRDSFRPKGNRLLEQELRQKGVSGELIRSVLARQQESRGSEKDAARQVARDRLRRLGSYPVEKQKEKLIRFLVSRGYSWEITDAVIDSLFQKTYNTNTKE